MTSATALERWAGCPFQYFLANVLRVEATERPESEWTVSALDRGSLIHQTLEAFFRERVDQGRSRADEPFTPLDHERLEEIASAMLLDLEVQGRTGHPVAWENARAAVLHDLHLQLDREEAWRREDLLAPTLFERTFGDMGDPDSWPAVALELADGSVVRFRGAIDRIDTSASRVLVIDYKSGGTWGFDGLDDDPVLAGRHLQLVLYARAARANVAEAGSHIMAEFRFVSSKGKFERRTIVADDQADRRLANVVQHAADGIRAGSFLPKPGEFDRGSFKNCRFCEYDRICSTARDEAWRRKSPNAPSIPLELA
jgi:ATP-dependent helicase/DNAse subunit B